MKAQTTMEKKERPIIFSSEMVKAILENRKSMTRRVVKVGSPYLVQRGESWFESYNENHFIWGAGNKEVKCSYGKVGDLLWVRRKQDGSFAWKKSDAFLYLEILNIKVERLQDISEEDARAEGLEPTIFTKEDIESIPENTDEGQLARLLGEGQITAKCNFQILWNEINRKRTGYSITDNPFVWCISFRKLET